MELYVLLVIFVTFSKVKSCSNDLKNTALQDAFVKICEDLAKRNHVVSFFLDDSIENSAALAILTAAAGIPNFVKRLENKT